MWGGVREDSWGFKVGFCRRRRSLPGTQAWKCFLHIHSLICSFTPIFSLPPLCSPSPVPFSSSFLSLPLLFLSALTSSPLHVFLHPKHSPLALPSFLPLPLLTVKSLRGFQSQMKQLSQPTAPPQPHSPQPGAGKGSTAGTGGLVKVSGPPPPLPHSLQHYLQYKKDVQMA